MTYTYFEGWRERAGGGNVMAVGEPCRLCGCWPCRCRVAVYVVTGKQCRSPVFSKEPLPPWLQRADALQEANAALAARVRELEEAQGELLGLLDAETGVSLHVGAIKAYACPTCRDTGQVSSFWGTAEFGGGSIGTCPACSAWRPEPAVDRLFRRYGDQLQEMAE